VVIGSAFFAVFPLYLSAVAGGATLNIPGVGEVLIQTLSPLFGAFLLLITITLYPGGIGQQILPFRRWLAGGPLVEDRHEALRLAGFPLLFGLLMTLGLTNGAGLPRFLAGLVVGAVAAFAFVVLLLIYLRLLHRSLQASARAVEPAPAAEAAIPAPAEAAAATAAQTAPAPTAAANPKPARPRRRTRKTAT
jgi:hypothetical protein